MKAIQQLKGRSLYKDKKRVRELAEKYASEIDMSDLFAPDPEEKKKEEDNY